MTGPRRRRALPGLLSRSGLSLLGAAILVAVGLAARGGLIGGLEWASRPSGGEELGAVRNGHAEDCTPSVFDRSIAGVSFVAPRRSVGPGMLEPVLRVGARWVGVLPYAFLDPAEDIVRYDEGRQWWGETPEGVRATIEDAHAHGLRVMVKPHLWERGGRWVGEYAPHSEEGWETWEETYARYILRLAALSDSLGVELFVVGTELDETVRRRPEFWSRLVRSVREVYSGPITYAANWDGYADVPFWGELDLIGVDAYFPLSSRDTPTLNELMEAWRPVVRELAELCRAHGMPVLFPEFGYRSIDGAAGRQWELPPERRRGEPANHQAQINAYEALFRTWWDLPWFAGGFLWKWFADDEERRRTLRADYTPQGKPVESVIRSWFTVELDRHGSSATPR